MKQDREFQELNHLVLIRAPVTTQEIRAIIDEYFKPTGWSLLKEEWFKLNELQRDALCSKILIDAVRTHLVKISDS